MSRGGGNRTHVASRHLIYSQAGLPADLTPREWQFGQPDAKPDVLVLGVPPPHEEPCIATVLHGRSHFECFLGQRKDA